MPRVVRHLFVCQNERPVGAKPSCGARGSAAVLEALQRAVGADPAQWGTVGVTPCGCLGPCFEGPMVVVYPEAVWYAGVTPGDAAEIVSAHAAGREVARLRYEWPED